MQRIANPYYVYKRRVGSTPTSSAIIRRCATVGEVGWSQISMIAAGS